MLVIITALLTIFIVCITVGATYGIAPFIKLGQRSVINVRKKHHVNFLKTGSLLHIYSLI